MTQGSRAKVYRATPRNISMLAGLLKAGQIVALPTETVYGLAANALDASACRKIFRAKGRPSTDPLIVHIHAVAELAALCRPNPVALRLARHFWPGPLTLVLPKTALVPDIVTAGRASVAVRMPSHRLFRAVLKSAGIPLAAPSANPFGYVSPTSAAHVKRGLGGRIGHILDGGSSRIGLESTVLDLRRPGKPRLLRPGYITQRQIEQVLGRPIVRFRGQAGSRSQVSPGLLKRHYSPHTPLVVHDAMPPPREMPPTDAFLYQAKPGNVSRPNIYWLDAQGDPRKAARRLFAMLQKLDALNFRRIHVERARGDGLATAINDRLRRAAAR